ncbi:MAG TPA: aldo/keto reductase [Thermotogota bacterium]|nr:aldo/keto reductase [Thermotogota bacterium]
MLYRQMPSNGDRLSALGFGCMRLPTRGGRIDKAEAMKQIRYAIDNGVNYIDTAWPYHGGNSEKFLGEALADGYREKVKLATKLPQFLCKSREDMYNFFDKQLGKLNVEVIDYYLIHMLNGVAWEQMKGLGIKEFIDDIRAKGQIRHIGFSFHGPKDDFPRIVDDYDWDFCQIQYNILDENNQAGKSGLRYAASKGLGVIIMEPLLGGNLAGELPKQVKAHYDKADEKRSNVEWALKWVWNHPEVTVVLSGMNTMEQVSENIRIASETPPDSLTEKEVGILRKAADTYLSLRKIPCTGCRYCMPCPVGVDIPTAFELYNNRYLFNKRLTNRMLYLMRLGGIMAGEKPHLVSQCVSCGKCKQVCPQGINIPEELKKVQKEFEGPLGKVVMTLGRAYMNRGKKKRGHDA